MCAESLDELITHVFFLQVRPDFVDRDKVREYRDNPSKLAFSEFHKVRDVACGHGFTIIAARHDERLHDYQVRDPSSSDIVVGASDFDPSGFESHTRFRSCSEPVSTKTLNLVRSSLKTALR